MLLDKYIEVTIPIDELVIPDEPVRRRNHRRPGQDIVDDIRDRGLLSPILVDRIAPHRYEVVSGCRRLGSIRQLVRDNARCYSLSWGLFLPALLVYKSVPCHLVQR